MPRAKSANDTQIGLRVPRGWLKRADKIAERISKDNNGVAITRADAMRAAIARGLNELEKSR
jgi:hypothetical protein